jgi:hypothetical protein
MARHQTTCLQIKAAGGSAERPLTCDGRQQVVASALCGDALGMAAGLDAGIMRQRDWRKIEFAMHAAPKGSGIGALRTFFTHHFFAE